MKTILTGISNGLIAASIRHILNNSNEFHVLPIDDEGISAADVIILEVAHTPGYTVDERLNEVQSIRRLNPACRILLMCDDNSTPELAWKVVLAKKAGLIDDFIYSSVSESYLAAMLHAI